MVERIRNEYRRITSGEADGKRMSQAELDSYRRQLIMLAVSVATVVLVLILAIGAYYQYVHLPRQSVATVSGETISRADYWDYRRYELLNQISQYQQFAQFMEGEQAQQYQQLAAEADREFDNVENSSIDAATVDEMITNRLLMDALDDFGLEITEEEIDERVVEFLTGMAIGDDDPGPAADPTAEAWATATAEAEQEEQEAQQEELEEAESDAAEEESDAEDAGDDENADDEETGDENDNEEDAEETATPEPEPTPGEEDIRATAEVNRSDHDEFMLDRVGISHDEFVEMFLKPEIAREKIRNHLAEDIPTRDEHVEASHILVATQDAAEVVYEDLTENDADFAELAEEQSTDQQTAPNGGELGWFPRGVMVDEFDEVVFDLEAGEISEPFQTDFGWHVVMVTDREEDRPLELSMLEQRRQQVFQEWLEEQREEADIDTEHELPDTTEQPQNQFQPPAGAPSAPQPSLPDQNMQPQQEIPIDGSEDEDLFEGDDPFDVETDEDES